MLRKGINDLGVLWVHTKVLNHFLLFKKKLGCKKIPHSLWIKGETSVIVTALIVFSWKFFCFMNMNKHIDVIIYVNVLLSNHFKSDKELFPSCKMRQCMYYEFSLLYWHIHWTLERNVQYTEGIFKRELNCKNEVYRLLLSLLKFQL